VPSNRYSVEEQSTEYCGRRVVSNDVVRGDLHTYHTQLINGMNNWCIRWFSRIFLLGILIFKRLTARRPYKSFGVKGLKLHTPWTFFFFKLSKPALEHIQPSS
jgi:hypothetical protein